MKFVMDERVKHRLTGLVVILSIAAIFVPALMKKSTHHFEENMSLSINLPAKPAAPKVAIVDKKALFQSVKVAHVNLPVATQAPRPTQIAKAEPISIKSVVPPAPVMNKVAVFAKAKVLVTPVAKPATPPAKLAQSVVRDKELYAVQLASFVQQDNAKLLVARLRGKGYIASYNKFSGKQGDFYKVVVGQLNQKDAAKNLQKQLVISMQLNGFVIKTGVS